MIDCNNNVFNYETEFSSFVWEYLKESFNLEDEHLESYLIERFMLLNKVKRFKDISLNEFSSFIVSIMNIRCESGCFTYKDSYFAINSSYMQSIYNIVSNWPLLSLFNFKIFNDTRINIINNFVEPLINKTRLSVRAKRINTLEKTMLYNSIVLRALNGKYGITPIKVNLPNSLNELDNEYYSRTLEEVCEIYCKSILFDTKNYSLISEKDIEEFLQRKLTTLFSGKARVYSQYNIGNGNIVDILVDFNDVTYIIELKNKKDDRLFWQVNNYYSTYKEKYPRKEVKILSISTEYDEDMLNQLNTIEFCDVILAKIKIENGLIVDINLKNLKTKGAAIIGEQKI